jgi:hypothetical protein
MDGAAPLKVPPDLMRQKAPPCQGEGRGFASVFRSIGAGQRRFLNPDGMTLMRFATLRRIRPRQ